jgi:hypothetical protein
VLVTFNATSVGGTASSNQNVCSVSLPVSGITLSGHTGIIQWQKSTDNFGVDINNIGSGVTPLTAATIGALTTTTYIRAVVTSGVCAATTSNTVTLTVVQPPTTSNAGPDQIGSATCGLTTVALAANTPMVGTGGWSIISGTGGSFSNAASPTSNFTGTAGTTYTLRWTITSSPCTASFDDVDVTFNISSVSGTASSNQNVCSGSLPVSGITLSGHTGTIQWQKSTDNFGVDINNIGSGVTPLTAATIGALTTTTYIRAVVTSGVCTAAPSNTVTLTVVQPPTSSNAGPDQIGSATCGLTSVTLAANTPAAGTGVWSIISGTGGTVSDPNNPTSTFSGVAGNSYTLRWTITSISPCAASQDDVVIAFSQVPNIVTSQTASPCNGVGFTVSPLNSGGNTIPVGTTYTWGLPDVTGTTITGGATGSGAANISGTLSQTGTAVETATFTVTPATANCTGSSFPVTVHVQPTPTLTSTQTPTAVCSSTSTNFNYTATSGSAVSFSWTRASIATINGNTAGSGSSATISEILTSSSSSVVNVVYAVTMTINGCSNTQNVTVAVNPTPTLSSSLTIPAKCNNVPLGYTAASATGGVVFSWTRAGVTGISNAAVTTPVISASINESLDNTTSAPIVVTYVVTMNAAGCTNNQNVNVTIYPTPTASPNLASQNICSGGTAAITFSGTVSGTTFAWDRDNVTGITGFGGLAAFTGTGNVSGTFTNSSNSAPATVNFNVVATANGCSTTVNNIATVQVLPVPTVNTVTSQTVCHNGPTSAVNFSGTGTSYTWTNNNTAIGLGANGTGNIASFTGTNPGTAPISGSFSVTPVYTVSTTNCNGGSQPFSITVNPLPVLTSTLTPAYVCSGSVFNYTPTTSITGVTSTTFNWSRAAVTGISNAASSGTGNPTETLVNTTSAAVNVTYVYTLSSTNNSVSCTNPTTYNVVVSVRPTPTVAASPNAAQSICTGSSITPITISNPNALAGTVLTWSRNNTANITGTSSGPGDIPAIALTNTQTSIQTTTFTATATLNGCSSGTTVAVQVNPVINTNDISSSTVVEASICSIAKQVTFTSPPALGGDGNYTYQWQVNFTGNSANWEDIPGATGQSLTYTYPIQNAFFRRIAYSDGCSSYTSGEYHVNQVSGGFTQAVTGTGGGGGFCSGGSGVSATLSGSLASATYTLQYEVSNNNWQSAVGFSPIIGTGASITFTGITTAGNYRISGTVVSGTTCTTTFPEFTVTVNPLPAAPTVNNPAAICAGTSTNIVANTTGGSSIQANWYAAASGGTALNGTPLASGTNYSVSPSSTTTYYAEALNTTTGCVSISRTAVTVTVNQRPTVTNTNPAAICSGSSISISLANNINPAATYSWIATDNPNTTGETITAQTTSTINNTLSNGSNSQQTVNYTVTATYPAGCSGTASVIAVTVDPMPVVVAHTATVCSGTAFTITPANGGGNTIPSSPVTQYTWGLPSGSGFTGAATGTNASNVSGTLANGGNTQVTAVYTVTPIAGACTGNTFTSTIYVNPMPSIVNQTVAVCSGSPFSVTPTHGSGNIVPVGTTYGWDVPTGSNISGFNVSPVSGQASINGNLTNTSPVSQVPVTATYSVTPTYPASPSNCVGSPFQFVATINPIPTASVLGTTSVCQGAASPNITFTGNSGIQPYTFTYTITVNGVPGSPQTINTSAGNTVTIPISTATAGTFEYNLSRVADAAPTGCYRDMSTSATVTVNPALTATLTGDANICASASSTLNIAIAGSAAYSGTLSPGGIAFSGNAPNISVIVSPATTTTYTIATISGTCMTSSGSATVTIPTGTPGVWTCSVSNDWFDCRNWANGVVPTNTTNVEINSALSACNPVINPSSPNASLFGGIARAANILISGSANLSFSGAGNLYVAGNWTNNVGPAGFTAGNSTVTFMGSAGAGCNQTISSPGNTESFYNLVINNTCNMDGSGNNVILSSPVNVSGTFTLTDGIVETTSSSILTITNPAVGAVVGGANNTYVNGPMVRNTNSTGTYIYPVGNPGGMYGAYRPAQVIPGSAVAASFIGQYYTGNPPAGSLLGPTGMLTTEYWDIRSSGSCATGAVVGLPYINPNNSTHWTGNLAPCSTCNVAIVKPAPTAWYFTDYPDYVGSGFNGSIPEDRFYTNNGWIYTKPISCTGFASPYFSFGFNYDVILPVKLISFEGKLQGKDALLNWEVADAKDLVGFELQHSSNGNNFKKLTYINSNNSNDYQYTDSDLQTGPHFYRLMLLDKNGHSSYSKTVLMVVGKNATLVKGIRPNPVTNHGYINIWSAAAQKVRVQIYDMTGRLIEQHTGLLVEGANELPVKTQKLAQGVYNILIKTDDGVQKNLRIVKE